MSGLAAGDTVPAGRADRGDLTVRSQSTVMLHGGCRIPARTAVSGLETASSAARRVLGSGRLSVASGAREAGPLARDTTRVHFDGFHADRAFEGQQRAWILLVGRHDDQDPVLNVYAELYRLHGVEPPDSAGRDKPPCCDENTDPAASSRCGRHRIRRPCGKGTQDKAPVGVVTGMRRCRRARKRAGKCPLGHSLSACAANS